MADEKDKFDPVKEFVNLTDSVRRTVEGTIRTVAGIEAPAQPYPPIDIYETKTDIILQIAFYNTIKPDNLEISVENNTLTVSGETIDTSEVAQTAYLQRELFFGKFSRAIKLSKQVVSTKAVAKFKENMLTISLPKTHTDSPEIINVIPAE